MTPVLWRVRLRTRLREWTPTSTDMPREQADELAADIDRIVSGCGDGWRFFVLEQTGGIRTRIRGRDVVGIEVIRAARPVPAGAGAWRDEVPPALPAVAPAQLVQTDEPAQQPAAAGTRFLQTLPERHAQVQPIRLSGEHR